MGPKERSAMKGVSTSPPAPEDNPSAEDLAIAEEAEKNTTSVASKALPPTPNTGTVGLSQSPRYEVRLSSHASRDLDNLSNDDFTLIDGDILNTPGEKSETFPSP